MTRKLLISNVVNGLNGANKSFLTHLHFNSTTFFDELVMLEKDDPTGVSLVAGLVAVAEELDIAGV